MAMDNLISQDVCEVFLQCLKTGKKYFYGLTSSTGVTQKLKQTPIRAGIGNIQVGTIQSEKDISIKVEMPLINDSLLEIQSGTVFATKTLTVQKTEKLKVSGGELTLTGTPSDTSAIIALDKHNKQYTGTYATGVLTLTGTGFNDNDLMTVVYPISSTTAEVLPISAVDFPKNYFLELHTIAYDPETNVVVKDCYWQFDDAVPDGGIDRKYDLNKNSVDVTTFTAQALLGNTELGRYIEIVRA